MAERKRDGRHNPSLNRFGEKCTVVGRSQKDSPGTFRSACACHGERERSRTSCASFLNASLCRHTSFAFGSGRQRCNGKRYDQRVRRPDYRQISILRVVGVVWEKFTTKMHHDTPRAVDRHQTDKHTTDTRQTNIQIDRQTDRHHFSRDCLERSFDCVRGKGATMKFERKDEDTTMVWFHFLESRGRRFD